MTDPHAIAAHITGLSQDSRAIEQGYLFAALPGTKVDGRDFIDAAIEKGATSVLAPEGTTLGRDDVKLYTDENPRKLYAHTAAAFYKDQPENIVAVTGTNGKTSVVSFMEQMWDYAGFNGTSLGTLKGSMTTPDAANLHERLAALSQEGVTHLALEASSHGLDQYRLDGVNVDVAAFTNLSHDHLDYHGNFENYFAAKSRLFSDVLKDDGVAVLNADAPEYTELRKICLDKGHKIVSYGHNGKDIKILSLSPVSDGQHLELGITGLHKDVHLPLVGEFQVMNVLCALGMAISLDPTYKMKYMAALEKLTGVRGRLELVDGHPHKAGVYVDYAHTPDALENVLRALRPHTRARLICVFGCGGDRDRTKRPEMGTIAHALADHVIVTDDNPRSEDPAEIRKDIMAGAAEAHEIAGRREAIKHAMKYLEYGDTLLIAGKGHEQGQIFADHTEDFDDVQVAKELIEELRQAEADEKGAL